MNAILAEQPSLEQLAPNILSIHADKYVTPVPGQPIDTIEYRPIMTAEEASEKFGFDSGALVAVIQLPFEHTSFVGAQPNEVGGDTTFLDEQYKEVFRRSEANTVYCFEGPATPGRHKAAHQFHLMGVEQIEQLRELSHGDTTQQDLNGGVMVLTAGDQVSIGRDSWLPGIGSHTSLLRTDNDLAKRFSSVSRHQINAGVNDEGHLIIELDEASYRANWDVTKVGVGEPRDRRARMRNRLGRLISSSRS